MMSEWMQIYDNRSNRRSFLDLDKRCKLKIIKYIIADCKMRDTIRNEYICRKYVDLINFALAHGNLEAILEQYDNDLYKSLEFVFAAYRPKLEIVKKIDNNRKSFLDLNEYCQRNIIQYIIADCKRERYISQNIYIYREYADLINLALAHENLEEILEEYDNDLYKSLQFIIAANRPKLELDFSELETTHTGKRGDAFWRLFANAISENNVLRRVILKYDPVSFQPNFKDHFELIKRALEHKESLTDVTIKLQGYSLDDLNNFGHITNLDLDVRMNAEALVEVCKANPYLINLYFRSTEILGRLSDIAPHCPNLKYLDFAPKPDIDGVEYAPLAELPNLKQMTLYGASRNGSLLKRLFEAIKISKRPGFQPLKIIFSEQLTIANLLADCPACKHLHPRFELLPSTELSNDQLTNKPTGLWLCQHSGHLVHSEAKEDDFSLFNVARTNSISYLEFEKDHKDLRLSVSYDFWDISGDSSPLEHSLATIPLIDAKLVIDFNELTLIKPPSDTDIRGFISILKQFNIITLNFQGYGHRNYKIAKLFTSIISESYPLKSIDTGIEKIDQSVTSELVKIKSITFLTCRTSDWESVELLSALTNLETVIVGVSNRFEINYSKALSSLINTCAASGLIKCISWHIAYRKIESIISQSKRSTALKIRANGIELSHFLEAFRSYRDLITIEELDVSDCDDIKIKDILKMAEVHPIKKLKISLARSKDIEHLSDLADLGALEELTIKGSAKGSLTKLFDQLAMKASPSLQCLEIDSEELSSEELVGVSKIRSLKKLDLFNSEPEDCESLMELANSNIEELSLATPQCSLQKLFSAFAAKTTTRLQHLKIKDGYRYLEICELEEISKIKSLRSVRCTISHNDVSFLRNFRHLVKLDIDLIESIPDAHRCLPELEQLESLTLRLNGLSSQKHYDFLADMQNLKELNLLLDKYDNVNLTNVYQAIVSKNIKLTHLTTTIGCVEELNEITQFKTLRKLHVFVRSIDKKLTCLGELSELESLQITVRVGVRMGKVLPILRCCRNLERLLINIHIFIYDYCLFKIYTHLKAIRDPTLQGPLTVIPTEVEDDEEICKEILVVRFENVYFKLITSPPSSLFIGSY